jgi:hypothetical protein
MKFIQFLLWFLLFITSTFAGTRDPSISDEKYIEYGKKFQSVGRIIGKYHTNEMFAGSATAIDPYIIITAAHVVNNSKTCTFYIDDKKYTVKTVICHKDFDEDKFGQYDIAICILSTALELDEYPSLYAEEDEVGKDCSVCGYGFIGTFLTGSSINDDKKRAGTNNIDYIDNQLLICSPSKEDKTALEYLIASGDSGGGLFIDGKLAGVNSCLLKTNGKPDGKYGTESGHTRISQHIEWIESNTKSK